MLGTVSADCKQFLEDSGTTDSKISHDNSSLSKMKWRELGTDEG